jgi:hypothetical protein
MFYWIEREKENCHHHKRKRPRTNSTSSCRSFSFRAAVVVAAVVCNMVNPLSLRRCCSLVVVEAWTATRWAAAATRRRRTSTKTSTVTRLYSTEEKHLRKDTVKQYENIISIDKKVNGYEF